MIIFEGHYKFMSHGGCCNCFICKIGQSLGLIECCGKGDSCCKSAPKKTAKKSVKKSKSKSKKK